MPHALQGPEVSPAGVAPGAAKVQEANPAQTHGTGEGNDASFGLWPGRGSCNRGPQGPATRPVKARVDAIQGGMSARVVLLLSFLIAVTIGVRAHDPGLSTAQADLREGAVFITNGYAPADVQEYLPMTLRRDGSWTQEDFEAAHEALIGVAPDLWEVRTGGRRLTPASVRVELLPEDNVSFFLVFRGVVSGERLTLRAPRLAELPNNHRQFLVVADARGTVVGRKLLSLRDATLEVDPGAAETGAPAAAATFWGFVWLGVEHIWIGYDHLLFLFALLIVCRSFRSIVGIISCFTLAHSITLALATFDLVNLPPRVVEAAIAGSIVYVGLENLWRRGQEPRGRWLVTFGFGLVHGFGFASVLRGLGIASGSQGIALPLFAFNLGVELGQVAVAAIVLPVIWRLRRSSGFVRRGVPALSAVVALAGFYWLLERTLLG